jgi:lipopolysaccharide biosynthesis regulator YciM
MRLLSGSVLAAVMCCGVAHAEPLLSGETAYPKIAIGYDALVAGDNERAIRDMLNGNVSRHDPAFLLNLGQAYARSGRVAEARDLFRQAARKREEVDLVLADGRVINSKLAARQALATVRVGIAAR